jgi:hypothetical protein
MTKRLHPHVLSTCEFCGEVFDKLASSKRFFCYRDTCKKLGAAKKRHALRCENWTPALINCRICGAEFMPVSPIYVTCGEVCSAENKRQLDAKRRADAPTPSRPQYIRCINTNDLYLSGGMYERQVVMADLKANYKPEVARISRYDFEWEKA